MSQTFEEIARGITKGIFIPSNEEDLIQRIVDALTDQFEELTKAVPHERS